MAIDAQVGDGLCEPLPGQLLMGMMASVATRADWSVDHGGLGNSVLKITVAGIAEVGRFGRQKRGSVGGVRLMAKGARFDLLRIVVHAALGHFVVTA